MYNLSDLHNLVLKAQQADGLHSVRIGNGIQIAADTRESLTWFWICDDKTGDLEGYIDTRDFLAVLNYEARQIAKALWG